LGCDIILIAPDKKLAEKAKTVIAETGDTIKVYEGSLSRGVKIAGESVEKGTKIVISRGATANLIKENLQIPVVEIQFSGYDVLYVLNKALQQSECIGIIGFEKLIDSFEKIKKNYPMDFITALVKSEREIKTRVLSLARKGVEVFIGGTAVITVVNQYGFRGVLLESGCESIIEAIREAKHLLEVQMKEKEKAEILKSIIDFAYNGIIGVDEEGKISVFNPVAEKIIGYKAQEVIGKYINDVITNTGMIRILRTGKAELGKFQKIGKVSIVTNRVPIFVNGEIKGAVATFQEVEKIQSIERKIRKKLFLRGHVAKATFDDIVGKSKVINQVKNRAKRFAAVDSTVLLIGETGTGKELFAQSIHRASARANKPFVAVNCAALPENLLESELFGYVEGAFTGARKGGKIGLFELAHTGTIFLDEVSEMSPKLQARFLRVIQEKEVTRIGDDNVIPVDIRIIAATNRDLLKLVEEGKFREDLYYRLCVLLLKIPPLRERKEDIPELAEYFAYKIGNKLGKKIKGITPDAVGLLKFYEWPGNVRQLENVIERAVVLCEKSKIDADVLAEALNNYNASKDHDAAKNSLIKNEGILQKAEKDIIREVIKQTRGNKSLAAKKLGISVTTLWRRLKSLEK